MVISGDFTLEEAVDIITQLEMTFKITSAKPTPHTSTSAPENMGVGPQRPGLYSLGVWYIKTVIFSA